MLRFNVAPQQLDLFLGDIAPHASVVVNVGQVPLHAWSHFSFSRNGSNFVGYLNGVKVVSSNDVNETRAILQTGNLLGARCFSATTYNVDPGSFFPGFLDEIRVSSTARSTNWVWASYMNMASNDMFNAYGAITLQKPEGTVLKLW